jgi:Flp pilus assembly protein TadD
MSVLYKALARAAKARESARDSGAGMAQPVVVSSGRGRRALKPLIYLLVIVIIVGGGYVMYGDDIADGINVILYGDQPTPPPVVAKKPEMPAKPQTTVTAQTTPPASSTAPAAVTPAAPAAAPAVAASTGLSAAAPAPTAPAAAPAAEATANPPTAAPAPQPAATATAQPATPAPTTSAQAPAAPAQAAPMPKPMATPAPPAKIAKVTPEQDLPAILDRIREQRTKAILEPAATVDRGKGATTSVTVAAPARNGVGSMVSVVDQPANARDETEQAYDLLLHGRYEGALEHYNNALKDNPENLSALLGKAIALHKLRHLNEARLLYQKVLSLDPGNREALTNVTAIVASQAPVDALRELRDLQKTYPDFSPIPAQLAAIENQAGDLRGAIAEYNRAIQLSPENGLYRLNVAILQDRAGMKEEAAASYQAALDRLGTGAQLPIPIDSIRARLRYLRTR